MTLVGTDSGYMSFHNTKRPRARKNYRCGECNALIVPTERYRRDLMVREGEAETCIFCADCDELMGKFHAAIPNEYRHDLTFEIGGLHQAVIELRDEFGVYIDGFQYGDQP